MSKGTTFSKPPPNSWDAGNEKARATRDNTGCDHSEDRLQKVLGKAPENFILLLLPSQIAVHDRS